MEETDTNSIESLSIYYKDDNDKLCMIKSDSIIEDVPSNNYRFKTCDQNEINSFLQRKEWVNININEILASNFIQFYINTDLYLCRVFHRPLYDYDDTNDIIIVKILNLLDYQNSKTFIYNNELNKWLNRGDLNIIAISPMFKDGRFDHEKELLE